MELEQLLLQTLSKDQLEVGIAEKIVAFHGLLTREVAIKLIAKEKGLLKVEEKKIQISEIEKGGKKIRIVAKIKKIWPVAEYRSGKKSRVIELEDESGTIPLVIWNDDVRLGTKLKTRDIVLIRGAYEKNGELGLGFSGMVEVTEKAGFSDLASLTEGEFTHVRGFVCRINGFDRFVCGQNTKLGFSFWISNGKNEMQILVFDNSERGRTLSVGDEVIIENALANQGRLELSSDARLMSRRKEHMLLGKIESIGCDGEMLKAKVAGKEITLERESGLRFLRLKLADDITLRAAIELKREYLLKNDIALRFREIEGKIVIEE